MFEFKKENIHPQDKTILQQFKRMQPYYQVKHRITLRIAPKVIAEIGVRAGYSGWSFLNAAPDAKYYALDANNGTYGGRGVDTYDWWGYAQELLSDYNTVFKQVNTQKVDTLTSIIEEKVDLFHVDGDHSIKGVKHDLDLALEVLSSEGAILVDDITYIASVSTGVQEWLQEHPELEGKFIESLRGEMFITRK